MKLKHRIKTLFANKQGLALVEFALFAPLLLVMFFSMVEFARYVIIMQKVERSSFTMANITVQYGPMTNNHQPNEIDSDVLNAEVFPQFKRAMEPYTEDSDRVSIISSLSRMSDVGNNSSLKINWQITGGGSLSSPEAVSLLNGVNAADINTSASKNGSTAGTSPAFPGFSGQLMDGMLESMPVNDNMIIVETFYTYKPIVSSILDNLGATSLSQRVMKSVIYSHPRSGNINDIDREKLPPPPDPGKPDKITLGYCWEVPAPPTTTCSNYPDAKTCQTKTVCTTCRGKKWCEKCRTKYASSTDMVGTTTCGESATGIKNEWWGICDSAGTSYAPTPNCVPPPAVPPPPQS